MQKKHTVKLITIFGTIFLVITRPVIIHKIGQMVLKSVPKLFIFSSVGSVLFVGKIQREARRRTRTFRLCISHEKE